MPIVITALPLALLMPFFRRFGSFQNGTLSSGRMTGMLRRKMPCGAFAGTMPVI
ncbi:hypothetical protein ACTJIL_12155 [Luteimonas sp. 22616]|uniref:hypothetical protein n=1 Tax=Luteimonas sp. 22616 TaxID=3453951 RepID=UPI003F83BCF3